LRERGVITRIISDRLVEVAFQRTEACEKCCLCHDAGEGMVGIETINELGAKREDEVEIDIPSAEMVKGSIAVFLVPIFFLVVGYLLGALINELIGIVIGLLFMGAGLYLARWKKPLRARIIRKL
jgi:positive regulator of sigma E activity